MITINKKQVVEYVVYIIAILTAFNQLIQFYLGYAPANSTAEIIVIFAFSTQLVKILNISIENIQQKNIQLKAYNKLNKLD